MFLFKLNADQKLAFLKSARQFAKVDDGKIDSDEEEMLNHMKTEMGIAKLEDVAEELDLSKLPQIFSDVVSRKIFLMELIGIAYAHPRMHPNQRDFLNKNREAFSISEKTFEKLEDWVVLTLKMTRQGFELLTKD